MLKVKKIMVFYSVVFFIIFVMIDRYIFLNKKTLKKGF